MSNNFIKIRIQTILAERGEKWPSVYQEMGWSKAHASRVLNGLRMPPLSQRVKMAKILNVDTSVIWSQESLFHDFLQKQSQEGRK